jgi:hypothetical protein
MGQASILWIIVVMVVAFLIVPSLRWGWRLGDKSETAQKIG